MLPNGTQRVARLARRTRRKVRDASSGRTPWPVDEAGHPDPDLAPDLLNVFASAESPPESPLDVLRRDTEEIAAIKDRLGYSQDADAKRKEDEEVLHLAKRSVGTASTPRSSTPGSKS